MSTAPDPFVAHCLELLESLGTVRARRMFGGYGLYVDDLFMALILDEQLYLKTDAQTRAAFENAGCVPFVYERVGSSRQVSVSYFSAPDDAIDSPLAMQPWARRALEAALRARAAKPRAARRAPKARPRSGSASKAPTKL